MPRDRAGLQGPLLPCRPDRKAYDFLDKRQEGASQRFQPRQGSRAALLPDVLCKFREGAEQEGLTRSVTPALALGPAAPGLGNLPSEGVSPCPHSCLCCPCISTPVLGPLVGRVHSLSGSLCPAAAPRDQATSALLPGAQMRDCLGRGSALSAAGLGHGTWPRQGLPSCSVQSSAAVEKMDSASWLMQRPEVLAVVPDNTLGPGPGHDDARLLQPGGADASRLRHNRKRSSCEPAGQPGVCWPAAGPKEENAAPSSQPQQDQGASGFGSRACCVPASSGQLGPARARLPSQLAPLLS